MNVSYFLTNLLFAAPLSFTSGVQKCAPTRDKQIRSQLKIIRIRIFKKRSSSTMIFFKKMYFAVDSLGGIR